jgi:hypothetical protein
MFWASTCANSPACSRKRVRCTARCHDRVTTFCKVAAAVFNASFSVCTQVRMVNAGSACPSHAEMTAIGTACACMMLAQECRASCSRI